jgi:hypothetical protein
VSDVIKGQLKPGGRVDGCGMERFCCGIIGGGTEKGVVSNVTGIAGLILRLCIKMTQSSVQLRSKFLHGDGMTQ